jgi:hypothetical protein
MRDSRFHPAFDIQRWSLRAPPMDSGTGAVKQQFSFHFRAKCPITVHALQDECLSLKFPGNGISIGHNFQVQFWFMQEAQTWQRISVANTETPQLPLPRKRPITVDARQAQCLSLEFPGGRVSLLRPPFPSPISVYARKAAVVVKRCPSVPWLPLPRKLSYHC